MEELIGRPQLLESIPEVNLSYQASMLDFKRPSLNIAPSYASLDGLEFHQGDFRAKYNLQDDVTTLESTRLALMFAAGCASVNNWDWKGYIEKHNLQRHFIIKETQNA